MTLTPLARRRLANFKANKRGYYSLWVFLALFGFSLFAELIANDKPIVLHMNGETYFPVFELVTEEEIGGELPIEADYADPYVQNLIEEADGWTINPSSPTATTPSTSTLTARRRPSLRVSTGWGPTTAPRTRWPASSTVSGCRWHSASRSRSSVR